MSVHEQRDNMSKVYNIYNCNCYWLLGVSFRSKKPSLYVFFSCEKSVQKEKTPCCARLLFPKSIRKCKSFREIKKKCSCALSERVNAFDVEARSSTSQGLVLCFETKKFAAFSPCARESRTALGSLT
jgi:hypothetical protein